jgi:hypothetical protein
MFNKYKYYIGALLAIGLAVSGFQLMKGGGIGAISNPSSSSRNTIYKTVCSAGCDYTTDGTADDVQIQAAIDSLSSTGGTVFIKAGNYEILSSLNLPYTNINLPYQPPIRITGDMGTWNGYWTGISLPSGGTVLDMKYPGDDGTNVASIDTRGAGLLEIDHLVIKNTSSHRTPFIFTTNTTLNLHDIAFSGSTASSTMKQDAIILGATSTYALATMQTASSTASFQGYGTSISNVFYDNIRRAITFGVDANGVNVSNNTVSKTCGDTAATGSPYYFLGTNNGNLIQGGIIEVANYSYAVVLTEENTGQNFFNVFRDIGIYDNTAKTVGCFYFSGNSVKNAVYTGNFSASLKVMDGPGGALNGNTSANILISQDTNAPTAFSQMAIGSLQTQAITSVGLTRAAGGTFTIDTGTGGSYLYTKAYANRFQDQNGTTKAEIKTGSAGGSAYFMNNVSVGTSSIDKTFHASNPAANATTSIEFGKLGQSKGTCLKMYSATGTATYCVISGTTFTCSANSCE